MTVSPAPTPAENMAAQMAHHPGYEVRWAIERVRILAEADWLDDAAVRRQVLDVLAGLDLAEQRRRDGAR